MFKFKYGSRQTLFLLTFIIFFLCRLFSENNDMFSFEDCNFSVHKVKESAARVVMWKEF